MPWESGSGTGKYQYHPGGDPSAAPKDAPSAVNVVVVPNVNLPKVRFITTIPLSSHLLPIPPVQKWKDGAYDREEVEKKGRK